MRSQDAWRFEWLERDVRGFFCGVGDGPRDVFEGVDADGGFFAVAAEGGVQFFLELDDGADACVIEAQSCYNSACGVRSNCIDCFFNDDFVV